jgi:peptide/nickel transport system permease protein
MKYAVRRVLSVIPVLFVLVTVVFLAMRWLPGSPATSLAAGGNSQASSEQISAAEERIRVALGLDDPLWLQYVNFLSDLVRLDFGRSFSTGEQVSELLARTVPVSLLLTLPGFVLGNLLGIGLALVAAWFRGGVVDKLIMTGSVVGMSISFLIIIIAFQLFFSSGYGLNYFPVRGWEVYNLADYIYYVTVPTLAIIFVSLGYNTRFYRAVVVEEISRDHVRTARAYGAGAAEILFRHVLKNSLIPIITRVMFSIPSIVIAGSLLVEAYFGIPGVGKATYDAITTGDQPVLKAVVGVTAVAFVLVIIVNDILYRVVDPRVSLR